jgi:uroporphyrinogen-III synthase
MRRLNEQIIRGHVDAIAFGSEPAAGGLFAQAAADGQTAAVVEALRANVTVACLGRRAAEVLGRAGVPAIRPGSPETDQLARTIVDSLRRTGLRLHANGHELEIRRHAVVVDGRPIPISPAPIAVLRALAEQPGRVLSRAELHQAMPSWPEVDEHAIEMAVSRLRTALADTGLIQTVMKRGYRLAV